MEAAPSTSPTQLSTSEIRSQFPILEREFDSQLIAYLDNGATSQKPLAVIEAIDSYYREHNANIHRSVYRLAEEATNAFEGARQTLAKWIGAAAKEVIFTKNATESINLVAYSWGRQNVGKGDTIVLTELEHHSNIVPWQILAQEVDATLEYVSITSEGTLDIDHYRSLLVKEPKLVSVAHISNVLGTINPVAEMVQLAHNAGAKILVDGAQAAPHVDLSMSEIDADFYVFTGHKMYGPTGIGVLYGKQELLNTMPPFIGGGDMISSVDWHQSKWNELPFKFEAGTSAIAEGIGLGAAVKWIETVGLELVHAHERDLTGYSISRLSEIDSVTIFGPTNLEQRGPVVSFDIEGIHPHDVAQILDRYALCIRAGHHCAQPLMKKLGVQATSRASFAAYNTREEIDRLAEAIEEAKKIFGV